MDAPVSTERGTGSCRANTGMLTPFIAKRPVGLSVRALCEKAPGIDRKPRDGRPPLAASAPGVPPLGVRG